MPDRDRDITHKLIEIGRINPDRAVASRAVGRALASIQQTRSSSIRRLIMRSTVAAAIILGLSLLIVSWPQHEASAAEQLVKVIEANAAYQGWVHVHLTIEILDEDAIQRTVEAEGQQDSPFLIASESHVNTVDGSKGRVDRFSDGRFSADLMSVPDRTWSVYESADGKLRISVMPEATADSLVRSKLMKPCTAEALIEYWRASGNFEAVEVTHQDEGGLSRFDITLKKPADDNLLPTTVWADPETGLIQKMVGQNSGKRFTSVYTYGDPAITNLYDLGVPRDALIIDNRPSGELEEIYKSITTVRGDGVGDYVALLEEVHLDDDGQPDRHLSEASLIARRDKAWLSLRYQLGDKHYKSGKPRTIAVDLPEGWPTPTLHPLIDTLFNAKPSEYTVHDGQTGWRGTYEADGSGPNYVFDTHSHHGAVMFVGWKEEFAIESRIWPTRESGEGVRTEVIRDEEHPGLIGLRTTSEPRLRISFGNELKTVWIDPARDYVIVSSESEVTFSKSEVTFSNSEIASSISEIAESQDGRRTVFREHVDDFAQLPDGRWYPRAWTRTAENYDKEGKLHSRQEDRRLLTIFAGQTLDAKWFTDPASRLEDTVPQD